MSMKEMKEIRSRIPKTTTRERLEHYYMDGEMLCAPYGGYLIAVDDTYTTKKNMVLGYFGIVYKYTTKERECESEVKFVALSPKLFPDEGHAIEWAINYINEKTK